MTKRSDQKTTTTTTTVDTAAEKVLRMRRGATVGDEVAVGPAEGLAPDTLAELERIQAQVFASYGMKETTRGKIVNRMKQLDED
jgi:thiamine monophosphate kinase